MTDFHPDYADACGTCYEVACDNAWIGDNYGKKLDRTYSCYDEGKVCRSVVCWPHEHEHRGYSLGRMRAEAGHTAWQPNCACMASEVRLTMSLSCVLSSCCPARTCSPWL